MRTQVTSGSGRLKRTVVTDQLRELATHIEQHLEHIPGAAFVARDTGELHALSPLEHAKVVRVAVETVGGRVSVVAGASGGSPPRYATMPSRRPTPTVSSSYQPHLVAGSASSRL